MFWKLGWGEYASSDSVHSVQCSYMFYILGGHISYLIILHSLCIKLWSWGAVRLLFELESMHFIIILLLCVRYCKMNIIQALSQIYSIILLLSLLKFGLPIIGMN